MSSDQTEHGFKLASRLEHPADCAQHEQPQTFIGELTSLSSEKWAGRNGCARCRPIPDRSDSHGRGGTCCSQRQWRLLSGFLFAGQRVLIFQIEHQVIQIRIVQGRCRLAPPERLHNINALRQDVVADRSFQLRVILKYSQTVSDAVLTAPLSVESRLPLTSSTVMLVWVFCKSLFKIHHLFLCSATRAFFSSAVPYRRTSSRYSIWLSRCRASTNRGCHSSSGCFGAYCCFHVLR